MKKKKKEQTKLWILPNISPKLQPTVCFPAIATQQNLSDLISSHSD